MSKYKVSAVKPLSPLKKYEYLRENGVVIQGGPCGPGATPVVLKGQELDDYVDEAIWREKHPGQEPIKEWEDGVSAK